MLGSIIGDIVGSIYEFHNIRATDFPFFSAEGACTDDSILSVATADWLLHGGESGDYYLRYALAHPAPMGGYGERFLLWAWRGQRDGHPAPPYHSCGNGSAMRVGPVGWACDNETDTLATAARSAACTHNHTEGIKGAQAVALSIFLARRGCAKAEIRDKVERTFAYDLHFTCDDIRPTYDWGATCQDSVPQAIVAFLDGNDFESCVRNAISIGGDSDTLGCMTGAIAEAFHGIPRPIYERGMAYLPSDLRTVVEAFEAKYGNRING